MKTSHGLARRFAQGYRELNPRLTTYLAILALIGMMGHLSAAVLWPQIAPTAGVVLKGKVPVNNAVLKVALRKPVEVTLQTGLRVLLLEDHRAPTFSLQLVIRAGGIYDPPEKNGRAQLTAGLLRYGTARRDSVEIARGIDELGSQCGGTSSGASTTSVIQCEGLIRNFDGTLDLFADLVLHPIYPEDELEKYKKRLIASLQQQNANPAILANITLRKALYGPTPAGRVQPTNDSIYALQAADLKQFYRQYYIPTNAFLLVTGDFRTSGMKQKIAAAFAKWRAASNDPPQRLSLPERPATSKLILIDRPGSVQTTFLVGNLGLSRSDPDYFSLRVLHEILGAGPASRLFIKLREEKGYTYGAYTLFDAPAYPGVFGASMNVRTEVTEPALRELLNQLEELSQGPVAPKELEGAKRSIIGSFAVSLDNQSALMDNIIQQYSLGLEKGYWDEFPNAISKVTAADVQRVAKKYLDTSTLQIVAVGDASKIRESLAKFGRVSE